MTPASLFIKLYLDEDVSVLLAELLRPHGFDVLCARDAHNLSLTDAAQLLFATSHGGEKGGQRKRGTGWMTDRWSTES